MTIKKLFTLILALSLFATVTAGALGLGFLFSVARDLRADLARVRHLKDDSFAVTSEVFDRSGEKIGEFASERRYAVALSELPKHVIQAFLSAEDKDFYLHFGVNPLAIVRSGLANIRGRGIRQGASTITQQLARLYFLGPEKTWSRKIKEALLAIAIERCHTKDEILELYLNKIFLGNKSFGIEAAARNYFRKNAADLSVGEAALLAGLPKAPTYYAPNKHPERANRRQAFVLSRMAADGVITKRDATDWTKYTISVAADPEDHFSKAPYFIASVQREFERRFETEELPHEGLKIYTTLDMRLQRAAAKTLDDALARIRKTAVYKHKHKGQIEGALLAIDPVTSGVLAMQGGKNFVESQFNRSEGAKRRVAGLFLPLCVSLALERGFSLASSIGGTKGEPSLMDLVLRGNVLDATRLFGTLGAGTIAEHMNHLGLAFDREDVTVALGYGEATPLQVAQAYAAFVNGGRRASPYVIERIKDASDHLILGEQKPAPGAPAMSAQSAYIMHQVLMQIAKRNHPSGLGSVSLVGSVSTATDDLQNAWSVGVLPTMAASVWIGAETGQARLGVDDIETAALAEQVWTEFLRAAPKSYVDKAQPLTVPAGLSFATVPGLAGKVPFLSGTEPKASDKRL